MLIINSNILEEINLHSMPATYLGDPLSIEGGYLNLCRSCYYCFAETYNNLHWLYIQVLKYS